MAVKKVTIHCSATPNLKPISLGALNKDHIARGFGGTGYHVVIMPDGTTTYTRGLNVKGAHVAGHNTDNIGICFAGTDKFTVHQFDKLKMVLDDMARLYNWNKWELFCHYEFDTAQAQKKSCPNIDHKRLLYWYISGDFKAVAQYT